MKFWLRLAKTDYGYYQECQTVIIQMGSSIRLFNCAGREWFEGGEGDPEKVFPDYFVTPMDWRVYFEYTGFSGFLEILRVYGIPWPARIWDRIMTHRYREIRASWPLRPPKIEGLCYGKRDVSPTLHHEDHSSPPQKAR
jgi:hypothetical protein